MSAILHSKGRVRARASGPLVPLAFQQRYAWTTYLHSGPLNERRCEASLRIVGELNVTLLRECLSVLVARHEALRTRIVLIGDTAMQEVIPVVEIRLEAQDVTELTAADASVGVDNIISEFLYQKIDYLTDPLFSYKLLRLSNTEHLLLIGIDHIVTDGVSSSIVRAELATLYRQAEQKMQPALPGAVLQYGDYTLWQLQGLECWKTLHMPYWQEQARRMRPAELPYDGKAPEHAPLRWHMTEFDLGSALSIRLKTIASSGRMMFPLVMLGIAISALWRWCGQSEWTVGMVIHGRHGHPELANAVGAIVSLIPLCLSISGDEHLLHTIKKIHAQYSAALEHQDYGRFVECKTLADCNIPWELLPTIFNWVPPRFAHRPRAYNEAPPGATITPFHRYQTQGELFSPLRRLDFRILSDVENRERGIVVGILHQDDVFTSHTLSRLGETIRLLADSFAVDPFTKPASLSLDS